MLETIRCYIKVTNDSDISDLQALYADEQVWRYLGGIRTQEKIDEGINSRIFPNKNCIYWMVRNKLTNSFLGNISLAPYHDGTNTEISYEFLSSVSGSGYATETVGEVIQYAFKTLGVGRLVAETQSANVASCNMLHRLGFYEEQRIIRFGADQIVWVMDNPAM